MKRIVLLPVGDFDHSLALRLCPPLAREFGAECSVLSKALDPQLAFHPERQQYHSTELLTILAAMLPQQAWRLVGLVAVDLYIPVLTFVFGEAQLRGPCAVVSTHRLRQECYGLPAAPELLYERALKETVHELGHTLGLTHCDDYQCAMAASHAVEWIDLKQVALCPNCREAARSSGD